MEKEPLHIYAIPGLAADYRIFDRFHIPGTELHFINWDIPRAGMSMAEYAATLSAQIRHPEIVLVGVSFGGMLAAEMERYLDQKEDRPKVRKVFVISTVTAPNEFPAFMKLAAKTPFLYKRFPYHVFTRQGRIRKLLFDAKSTTADRYLKEVMLVESNNELIKHSICIVLGWKQEARNQKLVHIHGGRDKLFPIARVKPDYTIKEGSHFMIYTHGKMISGIIQKELEDML